MILGGLLLLPLGAVGCSGSRPAPVLPNPDPQPALEETVTEPPVAPEPATLTVLYDDRDRFREPQSGFDVLHTTLNLAFDLPRQDVLGTAAHQLRVLTEELSQVRFDGRNMTIHEVNIARGASALASVPFSYDNVDLTIPLPAPAQSGDTLLVSIRYTAHIPRSWE